MEIVVKSQRGSILDCPKKIAKDINKVCSYRSPGYEFTEAFQAGRWDGWVRKFTPNHSFPSGLLHRIEKQLKKEGVSYKVRDLRKALYYDEETVLKNIDDFGYTLRDYQIDGLITGIENPYMIYWWATSAGKTVEFAATISALKKSDFMKTLILVTNKDLAEQHREELGMMLKTKIGLVQEGQFIPAPVTVAVINTMWIKGITQKKKEVVNYLKGVECLIVDEAHHMIESKMIRKVVSQCTSTMLRHGYSGSPYSLTVNDIELECLTGPPLSKVTLTDLIESGYAARPTVYMYEHPSPYIGGVSYQTAYRKGIVDNTVRNDLIVEKIVKRYEETQRSILVLIRVIKHGNILRKLLLENGIQLGDIEFIHGSTSKYRRHHVKKAFKEKILRIVIASKIWNEGIDVPAIDTLVKADGGGGGEVKTWEGKGVRSVVQQLGRTVRKPVPVGKDDVDVEEEHTVEIIDLWDNNHDALENHTSNRYRTYKLEPGIIVKRIRL